LIAILIAAWLSAACPKWQVTRAAEAILVLGNDLGREIAPVKSRLRRCLQILSADGLEGITGWSVVDQA
jgi:hypothetical protein